MERGVKSSARARSADARLSRSPQALASRPAAARHALPVMRTVGSRRRRVGVPVAIASNEVGWWNSHPSSSTISRLGEEASTS